jgi:hypothetical protein
MPKKNSNNTKPSEPASDQAKKKFVRDSLTRGDALPLDDDGKLPLSATHKIVEQSKKSGETTIQRVRFKLV